MEARVRLRVRLLIHGILFWVCKEKRKKRKNDLKRILKNNNEELGWDIVIVEVEVAHSSSGIIMTMEMWGWGKKKTIKYLVEYK